MKSKNAVSTVSSLARAGSKRESALTIFNEVTGDHHRKECIARFQAELNMEATTANTYYTWCVERLEAEQKEKTEAAIASKAARKYTAVKLERGSTDVISRVAVFVKRSDAEKFNSQMHYDTVVPGVYKTGQKLKA